jgi:crotonobetainyl-CoA:carnitine CoA-transferase CaiB-like acyl-CoA transferase
MTIQRKDTLAMTGIESGNGRKKGPLTGIRVVEYGVFHAGPGATAILGDLGAEVIKIESGVGDPERYWTVVGDLDMTAPNGQSTMFEVSNRNKKGIYLDIKTDKGREIFHRLVEKADVFLTNLRKSTKVKLGLDYDTLKKVNPMIIHANVSGYGPEGPMSDLGAFDPLGLAKSGLLFVTGSERPALMHIGVLDQATAIAASHAIITALFVREREQRGQEVHASLYSTGLWLMYPNLMLASLLGVNPVVSGDRSEHSPLRNVFCCKDGGWIIGTHHPESKYWATFCKAMGREDLIDNPKFCDDECRQVNNAELIAICDEIFAKKTRDEWMEVFIPLGLMYSAIQTAGEVADDLQAQANQYVVPFKHPMFGDVSVPGYPIQFSENEAGTRSPAPSIGEHTDEVLKDIGFSENDIRELRQAEVVK